MIELYSYKGQYPFPLPSDMTGYDINDFILAPEKPTVPIDKVVDWDGSNWNQVGQSLSGVNAGDLFGTSIKLNESGNITNKGAIKKKNTKVQIER